MLTVEDRAAYYIGYLSGPSRMKQLRSTRSTKELDNSIVFDLFDL